MANPEKLPEKYHIQLTVHNLALAEKLKEIDEETLADLLNIPSENQPSRWAKLAAKRMKEIQNQTPEEKEAWKQCIATVKENHQDLLFKHDIED